MTKNLEGIRNLIRGNISDMSYLSNQKLWKIVKERGNYYYEIKLKGEIIDRIRIEEPTLTILKDVGMI